LRGWGSRDKSLDNLSNRLDRLEEERGEVKPVEDNEDIDRPYATAEQLEQMSSMERYVSWFNWHVREIMPYYKAEVMRLHSITSDEYDSRPHTEQRLHYQQTLLLFLLLPCVDYLWICCPSMPSILFNLSSNDFIAKTDVIRQQLSVYTLTFLSLL
jgi:hypothetical protein